MKLQRVALFTTKRELFVFLMVCSFILAYALTIEYKNYLNIIAFDTYETKAKVLTCYEKTNDTKTYKLYKLQSEDGFTFYTGKSKNYPSLKNELITLELQTDKITFLGYLRTFYAYTRISHHTQDTSLKSKTNLWLEELHKEEQVASIYKALYTATPMPSELQKLFSNLGISHLIAISGFHLGVLSALLFFIFKPLYKYFQKNYFPYANQRVHLFLLISLFLLSYLLFLDAPPSLVRAYGMFVVGFILYERGFAIISMQTLFVTILLLLSFFPRLFFSLGFWLSATGVFYIFLFLIYFKERSKLWQFFVLPIWVYLLMLPYSLYIFGNFSLYHPLSIIWTTLFILFYPLSLLLHAMNLGTLFDGSLLWLLNLAEQNHTITLHPLLMLFLILLSFASIVSKEALKVLLVMACSTFLYTYCCTFFHL